MSTAPLNEIPSGSSEVERQSPVTVTTTVDGSVSMEHLDDAYSLTEMMTPDMRQVQEFEEILQMVPEAPRDSPVRLYDVPEIKGLFEAAVQRVQKRFTPKTVLMELQNIHQMLAVSSANEESLKKKLREKEGELSDMHEHMRRDPRVFRALVLAGQWRNEKNIEMQTTQEYKEAIEVMKSDIKDLENKLHNLQNMNNRIYKDLLKIPDLEEVIRKLEESVLRKENEINSLESEIETLKKLADSSLITEQSLRHMYAKAATEATILHAKRELEKNYRYKMALQKDEHCQEVNVLALQLDKARHAKITATQNFQNIAKSVKSLKRQLRTLESSVEVAHRQKAHLADDRKQLQTRIEELEDQIRRMRVKEETMEQQLKTSNYMNEKLKTRLGSVSTVSKVQTKHNKLLKSVRDKDIEIATCSKNEHRLEDELKLTNLKLGECKRFGETQQRELNNTKQLVMKSQQSLAEASRHNDVIFKQLEWTEGYLKYYRKKCDDCTLDNVDIMNALAHLESLCKEHEATIRIKDAKNDSLVLGLSNLEDLLKDSHLNIQRLRQSNLICQTSNLRQMELNDLMAQLLKFTEAEKTAAVNECNKTVDIVLLLQKQLVQRLNKIVVLYKDMCDLKATIDKQLQMLELQKKECNGLREILSELRQEDIVKTKNLKVLTQERDAFGAMVVQKNIIIQLLERKIVLLETITERGSLHYKHRTDDIIILKLEVKNLRHKMAAKEATTEMNLELRQELVHACNELQLEQSKRKALEELKAPKPHRYIAIKCKDPSLYEQLIKVHKLQRLLIIKHNELTRKEKMIINRDREIQKLKVLHLRRGRDNVPNQLREATFTLSQKNKQIKGLLSEINVLRFDVNEYKHKMEKVIGELKIAKEEIAKQKRLAIKDNCQHATNPSDLDTKPRVQNGALSVRFYRNHVKLQPLHNTRQRFATD